MFQRVSEGLYQGRLRRFQESFNGIFKKAKGVSKGIKLVFWEYNRISISFQYVSRVLSVARSEGLLEVSVEFQSFKRVSDKFLRGLWDFTWASGGLRYSNKDSFGIYRV